MRLWPRERKISPHNSIDQFGIFFETQTFEAHIAKTSAEICRISAIKLELTDESQKKSSAWKNAATHDVCRDIPGRFICHDNFFSPFPHKLLFAVFSSTTTVPREHLEWQKVVFKYLHLKRVSNTTDNQEYFRRSGSEMLQLKTSPLSTGQKKRGDCEREKKFSVYWKWTISNKYIRHSQKLHPREIF